MHVVCNVSFFGFCRCATNKKDFLHVLTSCILALQEALDEATEHWGIMVERVEM